MKNKKLPFEFNLQHFAQTPEGGAGTGDGNDGGAGITDSGAVGDANAPDNKGAEPTFDDILSSGHQAEFDRRVQKAIDTAVGNAQKKWQALTDGKLSEAERLSRMSKEEQTQYKQQKKEKELADKEAAIMKRELMAEAKNTLAEKKLPTGLAEVLNYADADVCSKSITAVEKAFQEAVHAAVEAKLKGGMPPKKVPSDQEKDLAKRVESLMMGTM